MGSALAERLSVAGFPALGWDIDAARRQAHLEAGHPLAGSAADVFERCERVVLSLPALDVSAAVLGAAVLRPGQVIIDTTSGDPRRSAELAQLPATYLDAPLSGSSVRVRADEATIFVGGSAHAFERNSDLFHTLARNVIHAGPAGCGMRLKLVTNLVLGLNRAALAEGLVLSRALGMDADVALAALRGSAAYSRVMDTKGEKMVAADFSPEARLSQHLRDVRHMLDAAARAGARLPLSDTHRTLLEHAEALGLGGLDNSAIIQVIG